MNNPICIIPARGGSKRIPRKNILPFLGVPCLERAISTALDTEIFENIYVSTEDPEISALARALGIPVLTRSDSDLSSDFASTRDVMRDAVLQLNCDDSAPVCCLYPVTPLLRPDAILKAFTILQIELCNFVFPVQGYSSSVFRAMTLNSFGGVEKLFPQFELTRTQDLPATYHDAGQFYWARSEKWKASIDIFSSDSRVIELKIDEAIDIDNFNDWKLGEALYSLREKTDFDKDNTQR
jgi:pseudaminic acid cytidylyltransferase